jgi:hypothetical protein
MNGYKNICYVFRDLEQEPVDTLSFTETKDDDAGNFIDSLLVFVNFFTEFKFFLACHYFLLCYYYFARFKIYFVDFYEGFLSQDNAGKNIDQVFSEYQERQKMQAVENLFLYPFISNLNFSIIFSIIMPLLTPENPELTGLKVDQLS